MLLESSHSRTRRTPVIFLFLSSSAFALGIPCLAIGLSAVGNPSILPFEQLLSEAIEHAILRGAGEILTAIACVAAFCSIITYPFGRLDRTTLYDRIGIDRILAGFSLLTSLYFAVYLIQYSSLLIRDGNEFWLYYNSAALASCLFAALIFLPTSQGQSIVRKNLMPFFSDLISGTTTSYTSSSRGKKYAFASILVISLAFLVAQLALVGSLQYVGDEGIYLNAGQQMVQGVKCQIIDNATEIQIGFQVGFTNPESIASTCNFEHPFLAKLLVGLLGTEVPLILGTVSVALIGYIAWELTNGNIRAAMLASAFMAIDPMFFGMSNMILLDIISIFFTIAAFAILVSGAFTKTSRSVLAGVLLGLSILSKETAVLVLPALVFVPFLYPGSGRWKQSTLLALSSLGTTLVGLQIFASFFTSFPTFVSQIEYITQYAQVADILRTNALQFPYITLVSLYPMSYGRNLILDVVAGVLFFVWLPIAIYKITSRKSGVKLFEISLMWLAFPYIGLSLLWFLGRTIIAYYAVQFVPPLALGAAYLLSAKRVPAWVAASILVIGLVWFVLFVINPTHVVFSYQSELTGS